jgi:CheY-like chemotaxis protein
MQRVLVIEDNDDNTKLITFLLHKGGYSTVHAGTVAAGIERALAERPDLILLDIQLPDGDGTQVLDALRADPWGETVPIIAVTSYAMGGDRERLLARGCTGYLEKPIDPDRVLAEIRAIVEEMPCTS